MSSDELYHLIFTQMSLHSLFCLIYIYTWRWYITHFITRRFYPLLPQQRIFVAFRQSVYYCIFVLCISGLRCRKVPLCKWQLFWQIATKICWCSERESNPQPYQPVNKSRTNRTASRRVAELLLLMNLEQPNVAAHAFNQWNHIEMLLLEMV